ncbi:MAG: hypothetical protein ACRDL7_15865, partial [Gaiellaceae bacterium]
MSSDATNAAFAPNAQGEAQEAQSAHTPAARETTPAQEVQQARVSMRDAVEAATAAVANFRFQAQHSDDPSRAMAQAEMQQALAAAETAVAGIQARMTPPGEIPAALRRPVESDVVEVRPTYQSNDIKYRIRLHLTNRVGATAADEIDFNPFGHQEDWFYTRLRRLDDDRMEADGVIMPQPRSRPPRGVNPVQPEIFMGSLESGSTVSWLGT